MSLVLLPAGGSESDTKTVTLLYSTANATLKASAMPSMQNVIFKAAKQVSMRGGEPWLEQLQEPLTGKNPSSPGYRPRSGFNIRV